MSLLVAINVTALSVLVFVAKPTPPPIIVHFVDGPDAWAEVGAVAAIVAALVAAATFFAVQKQIGIANKQLKVANDQLALGRAEVAYVKEDLELSRQQLMEIARRPDLRLSFATGHSESVYVDDAFGGRREVQPVMRITNEGRRATSGCQVVLFIPTEMLDSTPNDSEIIMGIDCVRVVTRVTQLLYPNDRVNFLSSLMLINLKAMVTYTIFYRVFDDFGSYPSEEEYGRLSIRTAWLDPTTKTKGFH